MGSVWWMYRDGGGYVCVSENKDYGFCVVWMYRDDGVYVCVSENKDYGVCVVDVQGWWGVCVCVGVQGLWGLCGGCTMVVVGVSNENKNRIFVN